MTVLLVGGSTAVVFGIEAIGLGSCALSKIGSTMKAAARHRGSQDLI